MIRKQNRQKSPFIMFPKLIEWLANLLEIKGIKRTLLMQMTDKILTIIKTRGKHEAIIYVKDLRLKFTRFILSISPEFESKDQQWFPKSFRPLIRIILKEKSYPLIRLVFSVLYITRYIRLQDKDSKFETIIERPLYKGSPEKYRHLVYLFLKDLGINTKHGIGKVSRKLRFSQFHMTSKRGPNGHALWSSYLDLQTYTPEMVENIITISGDKLGNLMFKFSQLSMTIPHFFSMFSAITGSKTSRRLSIIPDKEGKQREIAIFSYYEQAALLPLHNFLMKQLSRINQDCTDNQTKLFDLIEKSNGSSYHSIDLTAFTDRFPIVINHLILEVWFGKVYADAWRDLMVKYPFIYEDKEVYYNTGNPMGGYSSWASTTLAHHFFVWLACNKALVKWKKCPYMLLGDDIVIANDKVAEEYKKLLSEWCIEFSPLKTHTSENGFEFAKQIRLHDQNVSPFPLSALYDRYTEPFTGLGIVVAELAGKGWDLDISHAVETYYVGIKGWTFPYYRKKKPKIDLIINFILFLQGKTDLGIAIKQYVASTNLQLKPWFEDTSSQNFIREVGLLAMEVLRRTFKMNRDRVINPKTGGSLGELSTLMVMQITSLRDGGADCFDLIEAVPFLQVYGRAEETFLKLNQTQKHVDNTISGLFLHEPETFRKLFETVDIPLNDSGFHTRHRDVITNYSSKVSEMIAEIIEKEFCL